MINNAMKTFLVLEDGSIFRGESLLSQKNFPEKAGEVVFNTSHSGYEEIATDPSYMNQIVVMTAPMQGNYGIDDLVWESRQIWINGFVCVQIQNSKNYHAWVDRLVQNNVPIMTEVDTRKLVLQLRNQGTPWGAIVQAADEQQALLKAKKVIDEARQGESDWVWLSSRKEIQDIAGDLKQGPRIAILDFGCKENIIRELKQRSSQLRIFSSRSTAEQIEQFKPDGLMLTNGPGDPAAVQIAPQTIQKFLGKIPIFGICMGHQVLSIALGAKTYKLKFGHRGANHPIDDRLLNKIYMSSQNHGYAVDEKTLPDHVKVTHTNLNDQTVAGFFSEKLNCLGIQYHPESHPGPHDAVALFDFFTTKMIKIKKDSSVHDNSRTI
ncbi:MAG: glutamine-hydrolyzing carbamoyl-phosphate synthase small subunit [Pseudobdellovibrio sp.]